MAQMQGRTMRSVISVDISPARTALNQAKKSLSESNFKWVLEHTLKDTAGNEGRGVKAILGNTIPKDYEVTKKWVKSKVHRYRQVTGGGLDCVIDIPVVGERGTLGGIFPASGAGLASGRAKGTVAKKRLKRGGAKVKAKILKGQTSTLPDELRNQGGNPPFRLPNGAVVTRRTDQRYPLVRVVGRAVPQMVDRKFEDEIEDKINDYMMQRMAQLINQRMSMTKG